jgi:hypothetical protein
LVEPAPSLVLSAVGRLPTGVVAELERRGRYGLRLLERGYIDQDADGRDGRRRRERLQPHLPARRSDVPDLRWVEPRRKLAADQTSHVGGDVRAAAVSMRKRRRARQRSRSLLRLWGKCGLRACARPWSWCARRCGLASGRCWRRRGSGWSGRAWWSWRPGYVPRDGGLVNAARCRVADETHDPRVVARARM